MSSLIISDSSTRQIFYKKVSFKRRISTILFLACILNIGNWAGTLQAQNVGVNSTGASPAPSAMLDVASANKGVLLPRVSLTGIRDSVTIPSPATSLILYNTATAGAAPNSVTPGYYFWASSKWNRISTSASSLIPFSSGNSLNGASVTSAKPILMGFGNNTTETIDAGGESTSPVQPGGYSFVVPFNGIIQNLQVSTDLFIFPFNVNTFGLQYDFTVYVSPSSPNNGIDHLPQPYVTTALTTSVRFGFPNTTINPAGSFRSATNINTGSITVNAGDRVGVRVRTNPGTDGSSQEVTQLTFNASVIYTHAQ